MSTQLRQCPHCDNLAQQEIIHHGKDAPEIIDAEMLIEQYYFLTRCTTCQSIALLLNWESSENFEDIKEASPVYPKQDRNLVFLPGAIRESIKEARKVKKVSQISFVILVRRALEFICEDLNISGRDLKEKIKNLAQEHQLPQTVLAAADSLRILGNLSIHDTSFKGDTIKEDVQLLDDLLVIIAEYIYIIPKKVKDLEKKLFEQKKKKAEILNIEADQHTEVLNF